MDKKTSFTSADTIPIKIFHDNDLLNDITKNKIIRPRHIQFIPTNKCNMNCDFCSCHDEDRNLEMNYFEAKEVISKFAFMGCHSATITGGGEPLLHPEINDIIRVFLNNDISVGLVTNGKLLNEKIDRELFNKLTWCRISNGDFRTFDDNYKSKLSNVVKNTFDVDWAFSHVVSKTPNFEEIGRIVHFANDHDFTHVRLVADLFETKNIDLDEVKLYLDDNCVDDRKVIYQGRKTPEHGGDCYICHLKPVISADFKVYACCIEENESVIIDVNGSPVTKKIKDVQIGDFAYDNGEILNKFEEEKDCLEIILKNGRKIKVSKDHIMLKAVDINIKRSREKIINKFTKQEVIAKNLKKGDLIPVKYNFLNKGSEKYSKDELFLYGTYLAEGWDAGNNGFGLMLGLHEASKKDKILKILSKMGVTCKCYKRRTGWQIMGSDKLIKKTISKFGTQSKNKQIPQEIFLLNNKGKEIFLRAYFDGDGSLYRPNKNRLGYTINFRTISKKLASDLVLIFSTLGVIATIQEEERDKMIIEGRVVNCHNIYTIKISGNYNFKKLTLWPEIKKVSKSNRSPKRALGFLKDNNYILVPIKTIKPIGIKKCYDIQVDKTNMFYSSFGILTHNCGSQYSIAGSSKKMHDELCLGSVWEFLGNIKNQNPINGSICDKCYYMNYNRILGDLMTDIKHKKFV